MSGCMCLICYIKYIHRNIQAIALITSAQMQCRCSSILAHTSQHLRKSTWLAPTQFHNWSLADPHTRQAPVPTFAQLEELTRTGVGSSEPGGQCPKHGALACAHGTFLHVARQTLQPPASLHIMGPSQWPRVETTSGIQNPVCCRLAPLESGCAVVWNCPSIACWYNWQISKDTLNQYDIQDRFPVVELIYYSRNNGIQPN